METRLASRVVDVQSLSGVNGTFGEKHINSPSSAGANVRFSNVSAGVFLIAA